MNKKATKKRKQYVAMQVKDTTSAEKFLLSLKQSLQALCQSCMDFDTGVEIMGYVAVNIDSSSRTDYILNEHVLKTNKTSMTFQSNSFLAKKDLQEEKLPILTLQVKTEKKPRKKNKRKRKGRTPSEKIQPLSKKKPKLITAQNDSAYSASPVFNVPDFPLQNIDNASTSSQMCVKIETITDDHREDAYTIDQTDNSNPFCNQTFIKTEPSDVDLTEKMIDSNGNDKTLQTTSFTYYNQDQNISNDIPWQFEHIRGNQTQTLPSLNQTEDSLVLDCDDSVSASEPGEVSTYPQEGQSGEGSKLNDTTHFEDADTHNANSYEEANGPENSQPLEVYTTQAGRVGVIFDGFKFIRRRETSKAIAWYCSTHRMTRCFNRLFTTKDLKFLSSYPIPHVHNHAPPEKLPPSMQMYDDRLY